MDIAFVLYDGFTAFDLVGPYDVITQWPDVKARFVATEMQPVVCDSGLIVMPTDTPATFPHPEFVVVPGSSQPFGPLQNPALIDWIKQAAQSAKWMASVCTGSSIYAAAGLLTGRRATTHWAFREVLAGMGVNVSTDRVVIDEPFISGAGVTAGLDMALTLTARLYGDDLAKMIQLGMEYDPQPPFDAGSPQKAGPEIVRAMLERLAGSADASALVDATLAKLGVVAAANP